MKQSPTPENTELFLMPRYFISAWMSAIVSQPLLTLRNQVHGNLPRSNNIIDLFKGSPYMALSVGLTYSVISTIMKKSKKNLVKRFDGNHIVIDLAVSCLGGISSASFAVPIEQSVLLVHTKQYASVPIAMRDIAYSRGVRGLYSGFGVTVVRNIVIADFLSRIPLKMTTLNDYCHVFFYSAMAGFCSTPFEVVRCEQQLAFYNGRASIGVCGIFSNSLYKNIKFLFKGVQWRTAWFCVLLSTYTQLNKYFLDESAVTFKK